MGEHREVMHERLYLKEPRSERLRKSAEGRLRHLLSTGWRETDRWQAVDYITVRVERSGHPPRQARIPRPAPAPAGGCRLARRRSSGAVRQPSATHRPVDP